MKKALVSILVGTAGAFVIWRRVQADQAEQDLWAEATDPVR